jgi:hypothetical protein
VTVLADVTQRRKAATSAVPINVTRRSTQSRYASSRRL